MQTIWTIARNDLRQLFRERGIWINLVVIPLILAYVIGLANGSAGGGSDDTPTAETVVIDVVDLDNSAASSELIAAVQATNPNYLLCPLANTDADACDLGGTTLNAALVETRLREQTSVAYLEIPPGYGAAVSAGEQAEIIYRSNENSIAPSFVLQGIQAAIQRVGALEIASRVGGAAALDTPGLRLDADGQAALVGAIRQRADDLLSAQPPLANIVIPTDSGASARQGGGGFSQSVPGMATMYVMFAVFPAAVALLTERKQWTLQRLVTMPVTRAQILGGKLLARFILGMIQYGIVFAFGYMLGVRYGSDPIAIVLTMAAFVLCITALTLALTTLLKNESQASAITLLLSITLAPLGGAWWPLEIVPSWMQTLGHVSPVAWAMDSYTELIFFGGRLVDVLPYIGVLLGMMAVFFAFGVARFKYE
jgi:ABC-2 type transport system permease protein